MPNVHRQKKSGALVFVPTAEEVSSQETLKAIKQTRLEAEDELAKLRELRKQLEKELSE